MGRDRRSPQPDRAMLPVVSALLAQTDIPRPPIPASRRGRGVRGLAPGVRFRYGARPGSRRSGNGAADGPEQLVPGAVRAAVRVEIRHRVGDHVEVGEGRAGLQEAPPRLAAT